MKEGGFGFTILALLALFEGTSRSFWKVLNYELFYYNHYGNCVLIINFNQQSTKIVFVVKTYVSLNRASTNLTDKKTRTIMCKRGVRKKVSYVSFQLM